MNFEQSLSFEDVSKLFPLPLSEAADILGVSPSVLKKLCNENGLERWPQRKYLAGKSIEDIKEEAAKHKSSAGSLGKDKNHKSGLEVSKSQGNAQHPGNKTTHTWRPNQVTGSGLVIQASEFSDEFKYGFPAGGLSRSTNRWWGSGSPGNAETSNHEKASTYVKDAMEAHVHDSSTTNVKDAMEAQVHDSSTMDIKDAMEAQVQDSCTTDVKDPMEAQVHGSFTTDAKDAMEAQVHGTSSTVGEEKTDSLVESSCSDENTEVSLTSIRKRALDEGRKALKSGASKKYGANQLEKEEKILLRRIFQES